MTLNLNELVDEFKSLCNLEKISLNDLSDNDIKLLLQTKISELSAYTGLELCPSNHKEIKRDFSNDVYEVDFYPVKEISNFTIGSKTLTSDDYVLDAERGILYLHSNMSGMLVIEYVSCLPDSVILSKIKPLLFDMGKYMVTTNFSTNGTISSVKEGDVQVNYDTSSSLGGLIMARIDNLKNSYSTRIKVI